MVIQTIQTNGIVQEMVFEPKGSIIFFDGSPYFFDTKQTTITGTRTSPILGTSYEINSTSERYTKAGIDNNIKPHLLSLKNSGHISENIYNELIEKIYDIPLYRGTLPTAIVGTSADLAKELKIIGNGSCCGIGNTLATNLNDVWNNYGNADTINVSYGETQFTDKAFRQYPPFFNILSRAIDENLINASDELIDFVQTQVTPIKEDTSFIWDVYINSYRENALKGGYKTESIVVRWTCDAVNKATEEFLQTNPDYEYRADNTIIRLSAKDQKNYDFSTPFFQDLYGTLETNIPMTKLSNVIGTSDFMKGISEFIPALNTGDCYLYLNYTFQNLGVTDTCVCQIPLNSSTQNVDHLYIRNGRRGSVVRLHYGEPESGVDPSVVGWNDDARDDLLDDSQKFDDDSSDVESDISTNSNISLLTSTYAMTETNLKALGKKLWDNSFLENISMINNSPIENILSVKSFPFPISGGTSKNVILGNVNMEVTGNELPSSYVPMKTIGTFKVDKKFSGVLEWLNYHTQVICYLPYIGFVELNIKEIIDKTITLKYIYDVITGVCTACFYANNIEICKYSGTIAIDIPITASNRAQVESGYIMSALGVAGSLLMGNLMGVAGSAFGALMNQNHFTTKGSPSPSCDAFDEQKAFIIIDYPVYYPPTNYAHDYGYPCNLSMKLGDCKGFTKCANVDVDGLSCTEEERAELKRLLEGGVYL